MQKMESQGRYDYYVVSALFGYLDKGECDLNQSNVDFFVEQVAKNNSENHGGHHKDRKFF